MLSILRKIYLFIVRSYAFRFIITELKYLCMGIWAVKDDIDQKRRNRFIPIDLTGKVVVVTGGARGIGCTTVKKFLECNAHVIIACRNTDFGQESMKKLRKSGVSTGSYEVIELDLASFKSIRNCASNINQTTDKVHILVNNAGIMFSPYSLTENGFESQWGVNYLGPFLLTHLLFPLIVKASADSECRIVNVSSCAHKLCQEMDYSLLNDETNFITGVSYAYSKAAQVSFTLYLSKLIKENHPKISVFAVHPGIVDTDLFNGTIVKSLMPWLFKYICKDTERGAASVLYPCTSPNLSGTTGMYFSNCRAVTPSKFTQNFLEQKKLFMYTLTILDIKHFTYE